MNALGNQHLVCMYVVYVGLVIAHTCTRNSKSKIGVYLYEQVAAYVVIAGTIDYVCCVR